MYKPLLIAAAVCCSYGSQAQKIYGISTAAGTDRMLISYRPDTRDFDTLIKIFPYYQPTATKDSTRKTLYFMVPNLSPTSTNPDTLVIVKLADTSMTRKAVVKGSLTFPQYYNGKLYGLAPDGLATYDPATGQYAVTDNSVRATGVHSSDIDLTRGRYLFMKRNASTANPDTLFVYTIASRTLSKYPVNTGGNSQEMAYSPTSNKVIFLGALQNTAAFGVHSYDLNTMTLTAESLISNSGGTLVSSGTMDAVNNRYFVVRTTNNNGTGFNIIEYRLNSNTLIDHLEGPPGMGFCQYFDNSHIPSAPVSGIGNVTPDAPFTMYPNPAAQTLQVAIELNGQSAGIQVFDLAGRLLRSKETRTERNVLDIGALAAGSYVLKVSFSGVSYSRMFVKGY